MPLLDETYALLLDCLRRDGGTAEETAISEYTSLKPSVVNQSIDECANEGYVNTFVPEHSEDSEARLVRLTESGKRVVREHYEHLRSSGGIRVSYETEVVFEVPVSTIAEHRQQTYNQEGGPEIEDRHDSLSESALSAWLADNMNWSDVSEDVKLIKQIDLTNLWSDKPSDTELVTDRNDSEYSGDDVTIAKGEKNSNKPQWAQGLTTEEIIGAVDNVWNYMGFETRHAEGDNNWGIDVIAEDSDEVALIRVEPSVGTVQVDCVLKAHGALSASQFEGDYAVIATPGDFSQTALEVGRNKEDVELRSGDDLSRFVNLIQ